MTEREKVIKGLECCGYSHFMDKCQDCPYDGKDCFKRLKEDALALLKAQEPRVMTLEEVIDSMKGPVWFEGRSERVYRGWALVYDVQEGMGITGVRVGITKPGHITIWPSTELYGSKWRCWTSHPTDEQMEAVKWG